MLDLLLFYLKEIGLKDTTDLFITFLGVVVAGIGIIVTGIFSLLLWRATQQTNKLAEENYKLALAITKQDEERVVKIRYQVRYEMVLKLDSMQYMLSDHNENFTEKYFIESIEHYEGKYGIGIGITTTDLGTYFDEQEGFELKEFWDDFSDYKKLIFDSLIKAGSVEKSVNIFMLNQKLHKRSIELTKTISNDV